MILAISLLALASQAGAAAPKPILPDCVENFAGKYSLRLSYSAKEKYRRKVRAGLAWGCEKKAKLSFDYDLPESPALIYGRPVSPDLRARITQVQHGADVYRSSAETAPALAAQLLAKSGVRSYTVETNRQLTRDYGHGFAGAFYRSWIAQQPGNAEAKTRLTAEIRRQLGMSPEAAVDELRRKGSGTVVAVSLGLGWETEITSDTPPYVKDFIEAIRAIGIEAVILKRDAFGTMAENSVVLERELKEILASGKNVILLGLSKGAPEILDAASRAIAPYLDSERRQSKLPPGHGRITASVMLSPLYSGLLISDVLAAHPQPVKLLGSLLGDLELFGSKKVRLGDDYLRLLQDVTSPRVVAFTDRFFGQLPLDVTYMNGTGVIPGDGLFARKDPSALNPIVTANRKLHLAKGACDGLIEFPGNSMPPGLVPRNETYLFSSSHLLSDGAYEEFSLHDARSDKALYMAFINLALDGASR